MNRKNRIVVPTELEASIENTIDAKHSGNDDGSERGVLATASIGVARNEGGEKEANIANAPPKREAKKTVQCLCFKILLIRLYCFATEPFIQDQNLNSPSLDMFPWKLYLVAFT